MNIRQQVTDILEQAEKTSRKAMFIYSSDFEGFYTDWEKVINLLEQDSRFRVRRITQHYTITNSSNSDGEGAWDEPGYREKYFLTKLTA